MDARTDPQGSVDGLRTRVRVVVIEDHDVARLGLVAIMRSIPGMSVVAEASDVVGMIGALETYQPELVIVSRDLAEASGISIAARVKASSPNTRIVMTGYGAVPPQELEVGENHGAGYISMRAPRDQIAYEIDRVLDRGLHRPSLTTQWESGTSKSQESAAAVVSRLAPRQREVLALVGLGLRNREIGERLGVSTRTVQKTIERILRYLGVPNRTQAAMIWILSGRSSGAPSESKESLIQGLTSRQREVLALIAAGHQNSDIGARLGIGTRTVEKMVESILHQLQVPSRTQAATVWITSNGSELPADDSFTRHSGDGTTHSS